MEPIFGEYVGILKKLNKVPYTLVVPKDIDTEITQVTLAETFFLAQKNQADMLMRAAGGREMFLLDLRYYLPDADKAQLEQMSVNLAKAKNDFLDKIEALRGTDPDKLTLEMRKFYDYTNIYRNAVRKELAEGEALIRKGIKEHHPSVYKHKALKQMLNTDYPKTIKAFYDEDNYLKKRISHCLEEESKSKKEK